MFVRQVHRLELLALSDDRLDSALQDSRQTCRVPRAIETGVPGILDHRTRFADVREIDLFDTRREIELLPLGQASSDTSLHVDIFLRPPFPFSSHSSPSS